MADGDDSLDLISFYCC